MTNKIIIKFGGESGQGINATGKIFTQVVNSLGLSTFAYREYPSLIKGGAASYQIDFSNKEINSSSKYCNMLCVLSKQALHKYIFDLTEYGIVIYDGDEVELTPDEEIYIQKKDIKIINLDSKKIAIEAGGTEIMANAVILGFVWRILNQNKEILVQEILNFFSKKNIDKDAEEKCILAGYTSPLYRDTYSINIKFPKLPFLKKKRLTMTGNDAIALAAISCGVRAYYGYPMTPATSIFKFLGETANETGMLVKQAENEITAVQMAMGSMYMGTRSLTATSGGGFDLMIETLSCAGISETPLVIVLAQRTGAGTGLPTWTGAGDINTAVKSGHGDFPKCILSVSDIQSNYTLVQKAFNIAEKYQLPVILLTEKQIAESLYSLDQLPENLPIERNIEKGGERYEITDTGISPRWIPSKGNKAYLHSSDEHLEDGSSTEDSISSMEMSKKRMRKMEELEREIPEPEYYCNKEADTVFVGMGNTKNVILDCINDNKDFAYLHYEYIYPLKTKKFENLVSKKKRIVLVENNQTGQFGNLITEKTGYKFQEKLLKYDGRPFFVEDILDFMNK